MTQVTGFDIDGLNDEEVSFNVAVIVDVDGEDVAGFVVTGGKNSPAYQAEARAIRIESLQKSSKRKTALDASTIEGATVVAKLIDTNEARLVLSVVTGWFGFDKAGKPAEFDKAIAKQLLAKKPTWREKISAALEVDSNFTKG